MSNSEQRIANVNDMCIDLWRGRQSLNTKSDQSSDSYSINPSLFASGGDNGCKRVTGYVQMRSARAPYFRFTVISLLWSNALLVAFRFLITWGFTWFIFPFVVGGLLYSYVNKIGMDGLP